MIYLWIITTSHECNHLKIICTRDKFTEDEPALLGRFVYIIHMNWHQNQ